MSFDPKAYLASKKSGEFDPKAYLSAKMGTPKEAPSGLESFLSTLDSYTGAPARAGLGAIMEGKNPISPLMEQIGEDPELAPTARDLAKRMGLSEKPLYNGAENSFDYDPEFASNAGTLSNLSQEDLGTAAIGFGADLTNAIPFVGPALKGISGGAKAARGAAALGKAAKAVEALEEGAQVAKGAVRAAEGVEGSKAAGLAAGLTRRKAAAQEIEAAARELGAPVLPGQVLDNSLLQRIESTLQNSPTFVGEGQRELADKGFESVRGALNSSLENQNLLSELELGNQLKSSFANKISEENAPISELFNKIRESHQAMPLSEKSGSAIARNIGKIKDARISPSSPGAAIVKRVQAELPNLKSVDDVKEYRTLLRKGLSTNASSAERSVVANIDKRLKALEEGTVVRTGKKMAAETSDPEFAKQAKSLIGERKAANENYSQLMRKVETLGGKLGIKSPEGPSGFLNKLDELTPEKVSRKLFDRNDTEFLQEMNGLFPDQVKGIFDFEKAKILKNATKDFKINPSEVLKQIDKLSPEAQTLMFSPEQLKKIKASKTYLESLPKNANPSGTAFTQDLLTFTNNPIKAPLANARDFAFKAFLDAASKGDKVGANSFTKFGSVAKETGRKAYTAAEKSRKSLRMAALDRMDDGDRARKPLTEAARKRAKFRIKAMGE